MANDAAAEPRKAVAAAQEDRGPWRHLVGEAPASEHRMTYWAPWDTVQIVDDEATDDGLYALTLSVGRLTFDAQLQGREGQRALRDFVVAVQSRRSALASV